MSACVSRLGEFGEHEPPSAGDDPFCCHRCGVFDEEAIWAALTEAEQGKDALAGGVRAVLEKVRHNRDLLIDLAATEHSKTTQVSRDRFFRHYGHAISWSYIADELRAALGEPKDGLALPWDVAS